MKVTYMVLQIIIVYAIAVVLAYGLYWVGGGEGRSPALAILILMAVLVTTGLITYPRD